MNEWYKNPTVLIGGAVAVVVAYILMKNKGAPTTPTSSSTSSTQPTSLANTSVNPVGGSYSYLDGTGMQHIIATDPYGNLVGYSNLPPGTSQPQPNQLSSYVGSMSGQYLVPPWGGTSPIYSTANTQTP